MLQKKREFIYGGYIGDRNDVDSYGAFGYTYPVAQPAAISSYSQLPWPQEGNGKRPWDWPEEPEDGDEALYKRIRLTSPLGFEEPPHQY
jgi:hypothetical protein